MSLILINNNQEDLLLIPNEAIRVRVIANSDNKEDIEIKEIIKEDLNKNVDKILKNTNSIEEAREKLNKNLNNIHSIVEKKLKELNYNIVFNINYGLNYFPEKTFNGVKYDAGYYESLVITLGEGKGDNWWCCLFPPLCLIEAEESETEAVEYKFFIKEILDKYFK